MSRTSFRVSRLVQLLPLLVAAGGCALNGPPGFDSGSIAPEREAPELRNTPFYPQTQYQCGPAALATVLTAAGAAVTPEALTPEVYIPAKQGSLQIELVAATRRRGLIPYPIDPDFSAMVEELRAGRPVLVLQNLGFQRYPVWHYAVVIGYDPRRQSVLLRSGTHERLEMSVRKFRVSWEAGGRWGVVVLRAGEFPVNPDADRYLGELAALEALGHWDAAQRGYSAALERWPGNELGLLGLGNVNYGRGELESAESAYRNLIGRYPGHAVAYNNLGQVLIDRGCLTAARTAMERALENAGANVTLERALLRTLAEIDVASPASASGCPSVP